MPEPAAPHRLTLPARLGILALAMLGSVAVYTGINLAMAAQPLVRTLPTAVDAWVGFTPAAVLLYLGIYAIAATPACLVADRRLLLRGVLAYGLLLLSGVPFWLLWPVTVPRSPVPVTDLFTWGVALMRWIDPPANCFPSMHVGETVLAAILCGALDRRVGAAIGALALGVWWSTMALDQHWFLDGLAGALVAAAVGLGVLRIRPLPPGAFVALPLRNLWWAVALYALQFLAAALPWWLGLVGPADVGAVAG